MYRKTLLLAFLIGIASFAVAQKKLVDSLNSLLSTYTKDDSVRVAILHQLANAEMYDHPTTSAKYAQQALTISSKIKYGEGIAVSYRLLGNSFWAQANQMAALDNFLKGMKVADSVNSEQVQADLLGNLGMVYNDMRDYASALKYYKASLAKQIELKNRLREGIMRLNVGNGFYRLKTPDSSLYYYNQSIAMLSQLKNTRTIIDLATIGVGEVYALQGKYDDALAYLIKAKGSGDTTRNHRTMVHSRMAIAKALIAKHQYVTADKQLLECVSLAKEVRMKTYVRDALELLYQSASAQGKTSKAFDYFKTFNAYKDSIQNTAEASRIASLQLEYEMQKKSLEISVLKKEAQIQDEEIKLKSNLLITGSIVLVLIAAFLFVTLRGFRIQKSLRGQLADRNMEILQQRSELEKQRDDVIAINEEIKGQQEEAIAQRDSLATQNENIETLHKRVTETSHVLEELVAKRTAILQEQYKRLAEYAHINAFKLNGPVADINEIVELLKKETTKDEEQRLVDHLKKISKDLDLVIRSISDSLQHGLTAYEKQTTHGNN
jgi:two-component system NtrC family sensor kinase